MLVSECILEENLLATLSAKRELELANAALDPDSDVDRVQRTVAGRVQALPRDRRQPERGLPASESEPAVGSGAERAPIRTSRKPLATSKSLSGLSKSLSDLRKALSDFSRDHFWIFQVLEKWCASGRNRTGTRLRTGT
jgi:hypothetical protein